MANSGDTVRVVGKEENYEGLLLPNEESDSVVVKLDSGYNIAIDKKNIKRIDVLKRLADGKKQGIGKVSVTKGLPTISILHTGGTIVSKVDYSSGAVSAGFSPEELLQMVPEIAKIANIRSSLIANMMSEDILFSHYKLMADAVKKEIDAGSRGVIIGHGTDTLGYTAAALSFILENVPVPVLIVGSQRSSDRGSSDAKMNLLCAAKFIAESDFAGVAVCMHENSVDNSCIILPGTNTRKMHTTRRDAFKAVNASPIARVDHINDKIEFIVKDYPKKASEKFIVRPKMEDKVAILKTFPHMGADLFEHFVNKGYTGLVLESTGLGQAPTNIKENLPNYEALKAFIKKGGVVALTSQCVFGRVHPEVYTNCRRLADIGVVFCEDMITETAYVKLAWLLGNYPTKDVPKLLVTNMRGEISECSGFEKDVC